MAAEVLNLAEWHNVPFPPTIYVWAPDDVPVDLTGKTFAMDVRDRDRSLGVLISLETAANSSANGIWVLDAPAGSFRIQITKATMEAAWEAAYAAGLMKAGEPAPLVYDLLATDPDGFKQCICEGDFTIKAGVTNP